MTDFDALDQSGLAAFGVDCPTAIAAPDYRSDDPPTAPVTLHLARDGKVFCSIEADDDRVSMRQETVETEIFARAEDVGLPLEFMLTAEPSRTHPAPTVAHVTHQDGEIIGIDLSLREGLAPLFSERVLDDYFEDSGGDDR